MNAQCTVLGLKELNRQKFRTKMTAGGSENKTETHKRLAILAYGRFFFLRTGRSKLCAIFVFAYVICLCDKTTHEQTVR